MPRIKALLIALLIVVFGLFSLPACTVGEQTLEHLRWEKSGRTLQVLDGQGQPTGQLAWVGMIVEENVERGGQWHPYFWDSTLKILSHGQCSVEFQDGKQVLKHLASQLVSSSQFYVQRWIGSEWKTINHGTSTRNIRRDYPREGQCTVYLDFPDAPYDLQIGLEGGRCSQGIFGFRFRAPISGQVRFIWQNDGIDKIPAGDWEWIWARFSAVKGKEDRKIGVRFKNIEWRWRYDEAPFRDVGVVDSGEKKKLEIIFGPYDYIANEWLSIYPDTWGPTFIQAGNDDGAELDESSMDLNGFDSDGNMVGVNNEVAFDTCWRWDNVAVEGTAENGCKINLHVTWYGDGDPEPTLYGINETDPADWSVGTRPSQRAKTTASVAGGDPGGAGLPKSWDIGGGSPEIKTVIQELIDDGHVSGNAMAFVLVAGVRTGAPDIVWQSEDWTTTAVANERAELTVVYTPAVAAGQVIVISN